jgi:hypothetical protein
LSAKKNEARELKGVLVWADGRREETPHAGGIRIHYIKTDGTGKHTEVIFGEPTYCEDSHTVTYREVESNDATERIRRAEEETRARTWKYLRRGWGMKE